MEASKQPLIALVTLMQLEEMAREAQTLKELQFLAVNETRRLIAYRQAFLFQAGQKDQTPYHVKAASSVAVIERNAPLIQWLEGAANAVRRKHAKEGPVRVSEALIPITLRSGWKEFSFSHVLWCPLRHPDKTHVGGIWFAKETAWEENELILVQRLAEAYAYAWKAVSAQKRPWLHGRLSRVVAWTLLVLAVGAMFLPIRLSTLAPAKVVAQDPVVVSAPMDGVIADILVSPNTLVAQGQPILEYEDTNLRNQYEVAEKNLAVALAEYHKASQGAFLDAQSKAQVPLLKAETELRETERDYAEELLDRVEVKAPGSGVLLYADKSDWIGRPVIVGQRIMEIADPTRIEVRIDLPVSDAIVLREGTDISVFLDANPLETLPATLTHASYHAEVLPGDRLAYRLTARLTTSNPGVRIGWQGTAKIYGDDVSVFFLLFRRPISWIRQFLGL